jgi:hypothetical protein
LAVLNAPPTLPPRPNFGVKKPKPKKKLPRPDAAVNAFAAVLRELGKIFNAVLKKLRAGGGVLLRDLNRKLGELLACLGNSGSP